MGSELENELGGKKKKKFQRGVDFQIVSAGCCSNNMHKPADSSSQMTLTLKAQVQSSSRQDAAQYQVCLPLNYSHLLISLTHDISFFYYVAPSGVEITQGTGICLIHLWIPNVIYYIGKSSMSINSTFRKKLHVGQLSTEETKIVLFKTFIFLYRAFHNHF